MHGVSAHVSTPHLDEAGSVGSTATALETTVGADHPVADQHDHGHDTSEPCNSCGHEAASLCAFIVAAGVIRQPRPHQITARRVNEPPGPVVRSWSPDPPVPKSAFVTA